MTKTMDFLAGLKMTIVSGVFLIASLVLLISGTNLPADPAWITVIISGLPLLYLAVTRLIFEKWISSALLISIAMIASIAIGELFAAGEVAFIMAIGAVLEEKTVERAKKGIGNLVSLIPQTGRKLEKDETGSLSESTVSVQEISKGDLLRVLPGEAFPVDGKIITGNTSVDQSIISGESLPVDKNEGDLVYCGTINCYGTVDFQAVNVGQDSSLQKMISLVKEAENKKAPMQKTVDKWATWLVPIALVIAIITYVITGNIVRAVTILVVFCPCALALATPTSIIAAIGQSTKHGVLIKSGEALEGMAKTDCIAFDKTGTLTFGSLKVSDIIALDKSYAPQKIISIAAAVERLSEHPVAKSITEYAKENSLQLSDVTGFKMLPGRGVAANLDGDSILCGNGSFMEDNGIAITEEGKTAIESLSGQGKAIIILAVNKKTVGIIALSDSLRPEAKNVVKRLNEMGSKVVLLTGDNGRAAKYMANEVGIHEVYSDLLPEEKVGIVESLEKKNQKVCMIGDGVNDAPALKMASIGVAMGSMGSDIAIDAADIALMSDNIENLPYLKRLANSTLRTIKFNIAASMVINAVAIALSIAGLLNPISGALVHNAGSVLVVLNAALLYDRKFNK